MPAFFMICLLLSRHEVQAPQLKELQGLSGLEQLEPLNIPAMRAKMRTMPPADPNED